MRYVIGIDLGTTAVKAILVNEQGEVCGEASSPFQILRKAAGYSEQRPEEWVTGTMLAIRQLMNQTRVNASDVKGLSFSGQMHGLVLLDEKHQVLRDAILWNDTRTTSECRLIEERLGEKLIEITRNRALEGFTLPKLLWVQQYEAQLFRQASVFLLPKDYVRYRLTGKLGMDLSDAAGTLLLDIEQRRWSSLICDTFHIPEGLCPPLLESDTQVGNLLPDIASQVGLSTDTQVFAGGADNACGALGAGILKPGAVMCSIGTSGVALSYETEAEDRYQGDLHVFNHAQREAYYSMGVTLAAGHSLSWFKELFARDLSYEELLGGIDEVPIGSNGLLFTPYLSGERTPHCDAVIRGSWMGLSAEHGIDELARSVLEGITFSLRESLDGFREAGKPVETVISIGGGAKNRHWLQMQADIFQTPVRKLKDEQGPALGAAMLAAVGLGWFDSLHSCAERFVHYSGMVEPVAAHVEAYESLYPLYKQVYKQTRMIHEGLAAFRHRKMIES
ncbi:xylulokinase [Marinicrinis sediminis]|uniref:Xylulose kinase n=1 Tax=Marinicrinis sediminis TaxID=1652465 RepID=A0ABW5RF68_9BACL